jgi:cytochrome d ubiquinol oxidase subunit I
LLALSALIMLRKKRTSGSGWLKFIAGVSLPMPFLGAAFGWIFTEIGRQPFIVYPVYGDGSAIAADLSLPTSNGVSPDQVVTPFDVGLTMVGFTLLYAILAVAWFVLMKRYVARGLVLDEPIPEKGDDNDQSKPLTFSY